MSLKQKIDSLAGRVGQEFKTVRTEIPNNKSLLENFSIVSGDLCYSGEAINQPTDWSNITNGPTVTASNVNDAVANSHTHGNSTVLTLLGQDQTTSGLTFNGNELATKSEVNSAIANAKECHVVANISERDALTVANNDIHTGVHCYVTDATGDSNVNRGGAEYIATVSGDTITWIMASEAESLNLILDWAHLQDKPLSSVNNIDQAVTDSHTHTNKSLLDSIVENSGDTTINNINLSDVASKAHTHSNKSCLDNFSEVSGDIAYNGAVLGIIDDSSFDPVATFEAALL